VNYRHAFHAGNFADVVKHAVLALLVTALKRKEKPFAVLDTHAGIGVYDLTAEAARTGEHAGGIDRLLARRVQAEAAADLLAPYLDVVGALPRGQYPGSPEIVRRLLRPGDRLVVNELHPDDAGLLRRRYRRVAGVQVHERDAYEALVALVPPAERRGLVLVDPPFEDREELRRLSAALAKAFRKWPTGIHAVWYPLKPGVDVAGFHKAIAEAAPGPVLDLRFAVSPPPAPDRFGRRRLVEIGMTIVNPPWQLDRDLARLLPVLHQVLAEPGGGWVLTWLVGEGDAVSDGGLARA